MRFAYDPEKSRKLRANPDRGIGFEEAQAIFDSPYYDQQRSEDPLQISSDRLGARKLFSLVYEVRQDTRGNTYGL